jgi:hypothetical protein
MQNVREKPLDGLSRLLSITVDDSMQDWDIECADPNRVGEFCQIYERENLNDFEKSELMRLIIATYNESSEVEEHSQPVWQQIRQMLEKDFDLHKDTVEYWSLPEGTDTENVFSVTPLIRKVWHRQTVKGN